MVYAEHRRHWLEKMEAEYELAKSSGRKRKILFMAPRDHGKTETGITFVTRRICLDRDVRILWVSVALQPAVKRLVRIQNLLKSKRITEDWTTSPEQGYGAFRQSEQDKWTTTQLYVAREKLSVDPTLEAVGSGGAVTGGHFDIIVIDDLEDDKTCQSKTLRDKTKEWFRGTLEPMLNDGGVLIAIGCLAGESMVLMANGTYKRIDEVEPGDHVWAIDTDGTYGPKRVEARLDQGTSEVVEVKTARHAIKATPWHPFLVAREGELVWCRADELQPGEYIVTSKAHPGAPEAFEYDWMDEEFAWLLGFLFGDGWVNSKKTNICCAMGEYEAVNNRVVGLLEDWFPTVRFWQTPFGYIRGDSRPVARALSDLGLHGKAHTKRLPEWLYRAPIALRQAFLRGFTEADGSIVGKPKYQTYRIELCNKKLVEDLHRLCLTSAVKPGSILYRSRTSQPPNSPEPLTAESWSVSLNFNAIETKELQLPGKAITGKQHYREAVKVARTLGDDWRMEPVRSVEPAGEERVWDLTVEGIPSFVANGFAVHNTRKHADDIYGDLKNNPTFTVIEDPAIKQWPEDYKFDLIKDEAGRETLGELQLEGDYEVLWPGEGTFCRNIDKLLRMRESIGPTMFAREFQHKVIDDATAAFKMEALQRALARGSNLRLYQPPPGIPLDIVQGWDLSLISDPKAAARKDRDYTVGITLGRDTTNGDRYLLGCFRRRGLSQKQLELFIQAEYDRFMEMGLPPRLVAIEKNNFGNIIVNGLFEKTNLPLAPHQTGTNKSDPWEGVPSLSLLFENSKMVLPSGDLYSVNEMEELITELHGLGRERHDDMVMAMWIAECVLRPKAGGSEPIGKIMPRIGKQVAEGDEQPHPAAKRVLTNKGWVWRMPHEMRY